MKLTDDEVYLALNEGGVWDDDGKETHQTVSKEFKYADLEKGYINWDVVVKELSTDTYWKTSLIDSYHRDNENVIWNQVFPEQITTTIYN